MIIIAFIRINMIIFSLPRKRSLLSPVINGPECTTQSDNTTENYLPRLCAAFKRLSAHKFTLLVPSHTHNPIFSDSRQLFSIQSNEVNVYYLSSTK